MKNRFTIGEISKLHNLPIKTLRYYDEIDLFKPMEIDSKNGYRYYSVEQFERLNTIKYFKTLGISLKEMKKMLDFVHLDSFLEILQKEKKEVLRKISELMIIEEKFDNRINEIKRFKDIENIGEVQINSIQEKTILKLKSDIRSLSELELSLRNLENDFAQGAQITVGNVGLSIAKKDVLNGVYNQYNSIYIILNEDEAKKDAKEHESLPEGLYACVYYRGSNHRESPIYYEKMKKYIKAEGYKIHGDALERVIINEFITKLEDEHLTEIMIPVIKT